MYTYEELLHLSALRERAGEKEKIEERLERLIKASMDDGEIEYADTVLRADATAPSISISKAVKNAKAEKGGFIMVSEEYYEGEN